MNLTAENKPLFGLPGLTQGCPKRYAEGQARSENPLQTLEKIRPLFRQAGLTRIGNVTHLDRHDIPVTVAIRPNSKSLAVSSGKSTTLEGALVSGAMEALELYAAEEAAPESFLAPYAELSGATIPVELLPFRRFSMFHPSRPERWCQGWDLIQRESVAVPTEWVTMDLCFSPFRESMASFRTDSNGLASGNHPLEAICSALLESVERDAVTLHQYAGELWAGALQGVCLDSLTNPRLRELLARTDRADLDIFLYDCTSDIGVPVYKAFCCDREAPRQVAGGYGAHLDAQVAAERAILEAVQGRTVVIAGARDDIFSLYYDIRRLKDARQFLHWSKLNPPNCQLSDTKLDTPSFEGDLQVILERLQAVGLNRAIVVDVTPTDWPISVYRILVPGLEGYHRFNRPGPRARRFLEELKGRLPSLEQGTSTGVAHLPAGGVS